ncbi:hypothetical protein MLD38_001046 [Melastoma candidum]|uniref:Uncharacterized protein n=1 Tax=Melastoma candidum TaxID=119954 RepID=A0ACB9SDB4_9MYRT|nr:hypothetical protein MLD38_001046 [Melastoma candidum]
MTAPSSGGVPPGFRFHPTDEELLQYYLKKKLSFEKFDMEVIREVDLNKMEPWDLQERLHFILCAGGVVIKTDWIMHEYRLEEADDNLSNPAEDGWVVCRVFKKKNFFKVGNEGVATSPDSDQRQLCMNLIDADQHQPRPSLHRDNLYLNHHQPLNFDVAEPELALHYSPHSHGGLHPPPQYSLFPSHQTLIPNHKPLGYDYSPPLQTAPLKQLMSSASGDQCDSRDSDGFRYAQNGEQGLEVGTGSTQHQQMVGGRDDQGRTGEWGMLSHMGNEHSSKG